MMGIGTEMVHRKEAWNKVIGGAGHYGGNRGEMLLQIVGLRWKRLH